MVGGSHVGVGDTPITRAEVGKDDSVEVGLLAATGEGHPLSLPGALRRHDRTVWCCHLPGGSIGEIPLVGQGERSRG